MKRLPIFFAPIIRNGILRATVRKPRGIPDLLFIIMLIPTTPPSRIVHGTRNSSIANAAITAPIDMPISSSIILRISCPLIFFFLSFLLFIDSHLCYKKPPALTDRRNLLFFDFFVAAVINVLYKSVLSSRNGKRSCF